MSATVLLNGTNDLAYTVAAALTPTTAIAAFQGTGSDGFAGTLTLTPTPVISGQLVGIAQTSATNGASATVAVGPVVTGTFTSGADYYVSGSGGISTNATPVHVLKAKSTTEGVLDLRGAPEAGKANQLTISTTGAYSVTVPSGVLKARIELCGGGGANDTNTNYCGGNGADYISGELFVTGGLTLAGSVGSATTATTLVVNGTTYSASGGRAAPASANPGPANSQSSANGLQLIIGTLGFLNYNNAKGIGGSSALGVGAFQGTRVATGYGAGGAGPSAPTTGVVRITWIYG